MGLFFPNVRRKARQFEYKPRFYDPEKEAREERRRELCGEDAERVDGAKYVPGQFIRKDMLSRRGYGIKKKKNNGAGRRRVMIGLCLGLLLIIVIRYLM